MATKAKIVQYDRQQASEKLVYSNEFLELEIEGVLTMKRISSEHRGGRQKKSSVGVRILFTTGKKMKYSAL